MNKMMSFCIQSVLLFIMTGVVKVKAVYTHEDCKKYCHQDGIIVPVYSVALISTIMVLMLLAILALVFLLHRNGMRNYRLFSLQSMASVYPAENINQPPCSNCTIKQSVHAKEDKKYSEPVPCTSLEFDRQNSQLSLKSSTAQFNNQSSLHVTTNDNICQQTTQNQQNSVNESVNNELSQPKPSSKRIEPLCNVLPQHIMKEICEGILSSSKMKAEPRSLENVFKLTPGDEKVNDCVINYSTPDIILDADAETYDSLPKRIRSKTLCKEDTILNDHKSEFNCQLIEKRDTTPNLLDNIASLEDLGVYENPREIKNTIQNKKNVSNSNEPKNFNDVHDMYDQPCEIQTLEDDETSYVNAKYMF